MARFKDYLTVYMWVAGFTSIMIASAGVAIFPQLATPPMKLLYNGNIKVVSKSYSYKPGQRGVTRTFYRRDSMGKWQQIDNCTIILLTTLFYFSILSFIVSMYFGFSFILKKTVKNKADD